MGINTDNDKTKKELYDLMLSMGLDDRYLLFLGDGYTQNTLANMSKKQSVVLNTKSKNALPSHPKDKTVSITGVLRVGSLDVDSIGRPNPALKGESELSIVARSLKVPSVNIKKICQLSENKENIDKIGRLLGEENAVWSDVERLKSIRKIIVPNVFSGIIVLNPTEIQIKPIARASKYSMTRCPVYLGYHASFSPYGQYEQRDIDVPSVDKISEIFKTDKIEYKEKNGAKVLRIG